MNYIERNEQGAGVGAHVNVTYAAEGRIGSLCDGGAVARRAPAT